MEESPVYHVAGCRHDRWQYCRRTRLGHQQFLVQCLDCLCLIKLARHEGRLYLKSSEIPENATIHAWIGEAPDE